MISILIIDDEAKTREMLADIINLNCLEAKVVGFAEDVKSGINAIEKYRPDLILLDIKLPDGTGFDILSKMKKEELDKFHVIFITAFEEYAVKAFKFSALDYILKPVDPEELILAIRKYMALQKIEFSQKFEAFSYNYDSNNNTANQKKLVLKTQDIIYVVEVHDIVRCESDGGYTTFYTVDNRKIMISKTIKEYDELLSEFGFFRIHQSHIINLKFVDSFEKKEGGFVIMKDKSAIPVSSRKKDLFLKILNKNR